MWLPRTRRSWIQRLLSDEIGRYIPVVSPMFERQEAWQEDQGNGLYLMVRSFTSSRRQKDNPKLGNPAQVLAAVVARHHDRRRRNGGIDTGDSGDAEIMK